ncbi:hypothetical protein JQX13_09645 [Archangium violaceum]|uniref:hypothetical protein n=1 Tax=Archangium violaceum TaxID=83451 RepID=UPI00193C59A6|nr:hypothetical protein [Archangium violaceum]QRK10324.1 hypothetical protein JQX13_09645 [Archangium violaceum]
MRTRAPWPVLAALLLAAGCVSQTTLQPLPTTPTTQAGSAVSEAEGVRLVANGAAWRGNPSNLENIVTPVQVRIENQSGRALRIDYDHFVLVGDSRFEYSALAPFELREEGLSAVGGSGVDGNVALGVGIGSSWGWGPGPLRSSYGWGRWGWGPGWYGPGWYDPFYGPYYGSYAWRPPEPLPTRDMVRKSLPEGTLETGGTLTGFLYFQNVSEREGHVTLQARLVDARTGERFGTLSIPFVVRS